MFDTMEKRSSILKKDVSSVSTLNTDQSIRTRFGLAPNARMRHLVPIVLYVITQVGPLVFQQIAPSLLTPTFLSIWFVAAFGSTAVISYLVLRPDFQLYKQKGQQTNLNDTVKWIGLGILIQYAGILVANLIEMSLFGGIAESQNTQEVFETVTALPAMLFAVVLLGPIIEELIFRHVLFTNLNVRFGFWPAFAVSSILFGLLHADNKLLIYVAMSFAFTYAYAKTRRIIVPIAIHAFNNAIVFAVLMFT